MCHFHELNEYMYWFKHVFFLFKAHSTYILESIGSGFMSPIPTKFSLSLSSSSTPISGSSLNSENSCLTIFSVSLVSPECSFLICLFRVPLVQNFLSQIEHSKAH